MAKNPGMNTVAYKCYTCDSETGCDHVSPQIVATEERVRQYIADRRYLRAHYETVSAYWAGQFKLREQLVDLCQQQNGRYSKARAKQMAKLDAEIDKRDDAAGQIPYLVTEAGERCNNFRQTFYGCWYARPATRRNYVANWLQSFGRVARVIEPDGTVRAGKYL